MKILRRISALTAAVMALSLAACGSSSDSSSEKEAGSAESKPAATVTLPPADDTASETETAATAADSAAPGDDSSAPAAPDSGDYSPAMWKVTSPNGNEMYMMGSMHALKEECYPLPEYVQTAYDNADVLAVECDISDTMTSVAVTLKFADRLGYPNGETAADHLPEGTWEDIASYIEAHGDKPDDLASYQLWYLSQALEMYAINDVGLSAEQGIDMKLLQDAHDKGKEIFEVESAEDQMSLLTGFSDEIYSAMLEGYSAENTEDINAQMEKLYQSWRTGDIDAVADSDSVGEEELTEEEKAVIEDYNKQLLTDRNVGMAEKAEQLLEDGKNVFFLVGAAHYAGDKGIIALLEADGYRTERVDP